MKRTVGIITFHFVNNFGGALQAYALQRVIREQCQVESKIIDYRNWFIRFTDTVRLFPITTNPKEILAGLKTMRQRFGRVRKFRAFSRQNYSLTEFYGSRVKMYLRPPRCDKYVCGSDQIWNPALMLGVSPNYFLAFVKEPQDKIAYAPSFGTDGVHAIYQKKIKKYLQNFGALSVREISGQRLISELVGRSAEQLIDPTFLLEKREWEALGRQPFVEGKYILLYIMQHDNTAFRYAREIKERLGLPLVEISRYGYQPDFVDLTLVDVGPQEFLGLFRDAAYVCTNSYHGMVYSIIFEKEFCLIPCKRFRARIDSLMKLLDIHTGETAESQSVLTAAYDKVHTQEVIEQERRKSFAYLKSNLAAEA